MKKLLASDLDGTLLGADKILSERVKDAVKKWQDAGNLFVIATGRMISSLEYYADLLNCAKYIISCSGAVIYEDKKVIEEYRVPREKVEKLWKISEDLGIYAQVYAGRELVASRRGGIAERYETFLKFLPEPYTIPITYMPDFGEHFPENVHKLSFTFDSEEEAEEILKRMGKMDGVNYFKSLSYLYDIISEQSSKGLAVKSLCKRLGIREEDTYVAGDNENDLSMFEHFANSAIMGTAPEYLHDKAKIVLPSAEEGGVADFIERILSNS